MKKYNNDLSDNTNELITWVDRSLEQNPLPVNAYYVDASIEDICDAIEYILKKGWFGSEQVLARKGIYDFKDSRYENCLGVLLTTKLEDIKYSETEGFFTPLDNYPLIIGINKKGKENQYPIIEDSSILLKFDDGTTLTRKDYQETQGNKQKFLEILGDETMSKEGILDQQNIAFDNLDPVRYENIKMDVDKNNDIVLSWGDYTDYKIVLYFTKNSWKVLFTYEARIQSINTYENLEDAVKSFTELVIKTKQGKSPTL